MREDWDKGGPWVRQNHIKTFWKKSMFSKRREGDRVIKQKSCWNEDVDWYIMWEQYKDCCRGTCLIRYIFNIIYIIHIYIMCYTYIHIYYTYTHFIYLYMCNIYSYIYIHIHFNIVIDNEVYHKHFFNKPLKKLELSK